MMAISRLLQTMTDKKYSVDTGWEILTILKSISPRKEALEEATEIIKASSTEQEALQKIQARFGNGAEDHF